jgi:histidyl-tRNA synthetase
MTKQKPGIPKGTRDFGPVEMARRTYILDLIRNVYQRYGYQPLETPSIENLTTLSGKYGEEGDKLLYKIRSNKSLRARLNNEQTAKLDAIYNYWLPQQSESGLRYDLTVPFARYVVMNQHEITFPFRRYQIQPVWRADRPQKGRYREFYQCDADVVGTNSLICEAEIVLMLEEVFDQLGLRNISIKINNRKTLSGVVEVMGAQGKESDLLVAIDKLDKIGREKVTAELQERGFGQDALNRLTPLFELKGSNQEQLNLLRDMLAASEIGMQGIAEIEEVIERVQLMGSEGSSLMFDVTLARGLSYYTGAIFEVKANNASMTSSISGGGRYDNLTGVFGMPGVSGVGISFGVDRIYDVMEELQLFPEESLKGTRVLLICFDEASEKHAMSLLSQIRKAGISAEIYPDRVKLKKQFAYADKKGIPYTLVIGSNEMGQQAYGLKNLKSGEQDTLSMPEIIQRLKQ